MPLLKLIESFVAEEEGELTVEKGEIVTILEEDTDGWTYVSNSQGDVGLVPSGYTISHVQRKLPPTRDPSKKRVSTNNRPGNAIVTPAAVNPTLELNKPPVVTTPARVMSVNHALTPPIGDPPRVNSPTPVTPAPRVKSVNSSLSSSLLQPRGATPGTNSPSLSDIIGKKHGESNSVPGSRATSPPPVGLAISKSGGSRESTVISPRGSMGSKNLVQLTPIVLRIYTNEDVHKENEEKELINPKLLRTFKSIRATSRTPAKAIIDDVAKKLLLADSRQYHLFIIDRKGIVIIDIQFKTSDSHSNERV